MEITTVKGIFHVTDLQEKTFELLEDWLWFVIQYGAPAPEEMRTMIGQILEGEMPSEEMVATATRSLEAAYRDLEDEDCGEELSPSSEGFLTEDQWEVWNSPEERQRRDDAYWRSLTPEGQDEYLGYTDEEGEVE